MVNTETRGDIAVFRDDAVHLFLAWQKSSKVWPDKVSNLKELALANQYVDLECLDQYTNEGTVAINSFYSDNTDADLQIEIFQSMSLSEMLAVLSKMTAKESR